MTRFGKNDECAGCRRHMFQRMTIMSPTKKTSEDLSSRSDQLQTRRSKLSQPLPNTLRQPLDLIHNRHKISNSHSTDGQTFHNLFKKMQTRNMNNVEVCACKVAFGLPSFSTEQADRHFKSTPRHNLCFQKSVTARLIRTSS